MGPKWLGDELAWPKQPVITETKEASVETAQQKEEKLIFEQDHHNERKEQSHFSASISAGGCYE